MRSSVTAFVDHLNPIQLVFYANTSSYYPGQLLNFLILTKLFIYNQKLDSNFKKLKAAGKLTPLR